MKTDPNEETMNATCVQTDAGAVVASVDYQEATVDDVFDKDEDEGKTDDDGQGPLPIFFLMIKPNQKLQQWFKGRR